MSKNLTRLSKMNGYEKLLKKQKVVRAIREELGISSNDEFDILHEAILCLFELHEGEVTNEKFMEYHKRIKNLKEDINKSLAGE